MGPPPAPGTRGSRGVFVVSRAPRQVRVSILGRAFVLAALALLVSSAPGAALNPDGSLEGYVRDAGSGDPIPGALVRATHGVYGWVEEALSDGSGHYALALRPGEYDVVVAAAGHATASAQVPVGTGATAWHNVSLSAVSENAVVRGYVTESGTGTPITVGRVVAVDWLYGEYRNGSALNASGYYEIRLPAEWYDLVTEDVVGYSPGSTSAYLSSGSQLWSNFTLSPDPLTNWINGTVVDSRTYDPIPNATIDVEVDGLRLPTTLSNATGEFSVAAPSGWAYITVDALGYLPATDTDYLWGGDVVMPTYYLTALGGILRGYVRDRDTGLPVPGARVAVDTWDDFVDFGTADASGYYNLSVPADSLDVRAGATGYASVWTWAWVSEGEVVWANFSIPAINSRVRGYVVAADTGARLAGVSLVASEATSTFFATATTDVTGAYSIDSVSTGFLALSAYASPGYSSGIGYGITRPGRDTWLNLTVYPASETVRVTVRDAGNGTAIAGASVSVTWSYAYYDWGITDASGSVDVSSPAGPTAYVWASALGYLSGSVSLTVLPGTNPVTILLLRNLPADVMLRGYVTDGGGSPASGAQVEVSGYPGEETDDYADGSGYYEMSIVAARQTVVASDWDGVSNATVVDPAPGSIVWLNLTILPDNDPPEIVAFTATPDVGVSPANPTDLLADLRDPSVASAYLQYYRLASVAGTLGTFQFAAYGSAMVLSTTAPTVFQATASWDASAAGGTLADGARSAWWPMPVSAGPNTRATYGYWRNATLGPLASTVIFDSPTGRLRVILVPTIGYLTPADMPGATFQPYSNAITVDLTTDAIVSASLYLGPTFTVGSLGLAPQDILPTGTAGALLSVYDTAGEWNQSFVSFGVTSTDTVDPTANAGPDQAIDEDVLVTFDGRASSDDVGVTSYEWTFTDGGPQTLTGAVAAWTFATPGSYVVTLTVRDAAGHSSTDTVVVTVRDVTPPTVAIATPADGADVSGYADVTLTYADNVGIARVELLVDGVVVATDSSVPFGFRLDARSLALGNHTIEVVAYDAAGNSASDSRRIVVLPYAGTGLPGDAGLLLILLLFGGIAAAILAVALLAVRRNRRRGMPGMAPPAAPVAPPAGPPVQPAPASPPEAATGPDPAPSEPAALPDLDEL